MCCVSPVCFEEVKGAEWQSNIVDTIHGRVRGGGSGEVYTNLAGEIPSPRSTPACISQSRATFLSDADTTRANP